MALLHLLSRSPYTTSDLSACQRLLSPDDAILLCGDAVYALLPNTDFAQMLLELPESNLIFALDEDVQARGLNPPERVQTVDYPDFVELCTRYDKVNSWL